MEGANAPALSARLAALGLAPGEIQRIYRTFNAAATPFADEANRHGD
jgi:hypothetical protein